jgi:hypothetical protein
LIQQINSKTLIRKEEEITNEKPLLLQALILARAPIIIAVILTPIRYLLELRGVPEISFLLLACYG